MLTSCHASTQTRELARFACSLRYADLPEAVTHNARRALVDWLAATLGGAREPAAGKVRAVVVATAASGPASIIGSGITTSAPFAALANAYASHLLDFDDCYNPVETTIHLSSCLWGAILAIGQMRALDGEDVLAAYVAGFEVGARVARAAGATHYQSAWHVTGVCGHVAAAAAAASALGLSPEEATHALGVAATQGAGIREVYGSDTKAIHPGKAAMDGVLSALLAEAGFTSIDTAIEGERGLLRAVSKAPDNSLLTGGLGNDWAILENGNKLYPTASLTHPPIEAAIEAARSGTVDPDDIQGITIRVHPFTAAVTAITHPADGQAARFSTAHCVAVPLVRGDLTLSDFDEGAIDDARIRQLRDLVILAADQAMDRRGCELILVMRSGPPLHFAVERNRGTPAVPLTDPELAEKFKTVAGSDLSAAEADAILARAWSLEFCNNINDFMRMFAV